MYNSTTTPRPRNLRNLVEKFHARISSLEVGGSGSGDWTGGAGGGEWVCGSCWGFEMRGER